MDVITFQGFISKNDIKNPKYEIEYLLDPSNDGQVRDILPLKIKNFEIKLLEWSHFSGAPNEKMPWTAHCYWNITYDYTFLADNEQELSQREKRQQSPVIARQKTSESPEIQRQQTIEKKEQLPPKKPSSLLPPRQPTRNSNRDPLPKIQNQNGKPPISSKRASSIQKMSRESSPKNTSPKRKIIRSKSSSSIKRNSRGKVTLVVNCKLLEISWAKATFDDDLLEHETGHYLLGCLCALEFKRQVERLNSFTSENHQLEVKRIFQSNMRTFLSIEKNYDEETNHYFKWDIQKKWNRKIKEQLLLYDQYFSN